MNARDMRIAFVVSLLVVLMGFVAGLLWEIIPYILKVEVAVSVQDMDGRALDRAIISVDGEVRRVTDSLGKATFDVPRGDTLRISVKKKDYVSADTGGPADTTLVVDRRRHELTFVLAPSIFDMELTGRVIDARTKKGIRNARVKVEADWGKFALGRTNQNGEFRGTISVRRGQEANLTVGKANYRQGKQHFVAQESQKSFEVRLYSAWARLVKLSTQNNIGGVRVLLNGSPIGRTDPQGRLTKSISGTSGQRMTMSFQKEGTRIEPWEFILGPEGETIGHKIELWPPQSVSLRLRAFKENEPMPGVPFVVNEQNTGATTDLEGVLVLGAEGLRIGDRVRVKVDTVWLGEERKVDREEPEGGRVIVRPGVSQEYEVTFWIRQVISVDIRTNYMGSPLSGVKVYRGEEELGRSENGRFKWELPVPSAFYTLRFCAPWFECTEQEVGKDGPVSIEMKKLFFTATVMDSVTQQPLGEVQVHNLDGDPVATAFTGRARVPIKELGTVQLRLSKGERYLRQERTVEIAKNEEEKTFRLVPVKPSITLTFKWEASDAGPVSNAKVEISGLGYMDEQWTDAQGTVHLASYSIKEDHVYRVKVTGRFGQVTVVDEADVGPVTFPVYTEELTVRITVHVVLTTSSDPGAQIELLDAKGTSISSGTGRLERELAFGEQYVVRIIGTPGTGGIRIEEDLYVDRPDTMETDYNVLDPYLVGQALLEQGKVDEAIAKFSKVHGESKYYCEARKELAEIYRKGNNLAGAASEYDEVLKSPNPGEYPSNPSFLLRAATCNYELADTLKGVSARQKYDRAFELVREAYTYKSSLQPRSRVLDLFYYQALILHERYFRTLKDQMSEEERCIELEDIEQYWIRFRDEVRNLGKTDLRDFRQRIGQIQDERVLLGCK